MAHQEISYINVVDLLLQKVPELRPLFDEHVQQNDELLPHVFFGDLTRYIMDRVRMAENGAGPSSPGVISRILDFLEQAMSSSDQKVQELVSVSFLENLDPSNEAFEKLEAILGPNLRRELETYRR